jgi:hypothetical protein
LKENTNKIDPFKIGSICSRLETVSDSERDKKIHPKLILDTIEEKINFK